jgi:hypothetical protein
VTDGAFTDDDSWVTVTMMIVITNDDYYYYDHDSVIMIMMPVTVISPGHCRSESAAVAAPGAPAGATADSGPGGLGTPRPGTRMPA